MAKRSAGGKHLAPLLAAAGVLVIVLGIVLLAVFAGSDAGGKLTEVKAMEDLSFQSAPETGSVIRAKVRVSGDQLQNLFCLAEGPSGSTPIPSQSWTQENDRVVFLMPAPGAPEGSYRVTCGRRVEGEAIPGSPSVSQSIDLRHSDALAVAREISGIYRVPRWTLAPNQAPNPAGFEEVPVTFRFFRDGSLERQVANLTPLRLKAAGQGQYQAEENVTADLVEAHVVRFEGDNAVTSTEYRWRGGSTFYTDGTWERLRAQ